MRILIVILARVDQGQIRDGLVIGAQANRRLAPHTRTVGDTQDQDAQESVHARRVGRTDPTQENDVAPDELDPFLVGQDPGVAHALELIGREPPAPRFCHR
jgi:hypothetical protein